MSRLMTELQGLGRALMAPIAVLPVAGLLLRLGQPDLLGIPLLAAAGDAVFTNLGLIFAIGVAIGLARENHGAAGLAGLVGFLVATHGADALLTPPAGTTDGLAGSAAAAALRAWHEQQLAKLSMPVGIVSGVIAGHLYNRYADIRLPSYLSFFGGRRFVPIATGCVGVALAVVVGIGWPAVAAAMDALSHKVIDAGNLGLFGYGLLNRLLIVTGLHHILNNIAWFLIGDFHGATGDLKRFFAGDPLAGAFMSGFFPVMMAGLPGACLAMYRTALPERRAQVGGLLLSMALTSFLTGVTEPIEFSFMFLAPALYAVHALLTGLAMVLMHALGVRLGFTFSAGLFDYLLNFSRASRPLLLLPVGVGYFGLYYGLFRYGITRFNLATPGRETTASAVPLASAAPGDRAAAFIEALGGAGNLTTVDACTTRLRLVVVSATAVDEGRLQNLGARAVVRPSPTAVQVVIGPTADQVASEIRARLRAGPAIAPPGALLVALGGRDNIRAIETAAGRVLVTLRDHGRADVGTLRLAGIKGGALSPQGILHLLPDGDAASLAEALRDAADG